MEFVEKYDEFVIVKEPEENCAKENMLSKIIKVLRIFEINKIISIDDYWLDKELEIGVDAAIANIPNFEFKEKVERIVSNEDIVDLEDLKNVIEEDKYSSEDNEVLKQFYNRYVKHTQNTTEPTLEVLDKVLIELKTRCKDLEITRQDKQLNSNDIKKYKNSNNLFILDRNMSETRGSKDAILDSILELKKENDSNLILIYSNECEGDFSTYENKLKLLDEKNICGDEEQIAIVYQLWAINKTVDFNEFLNQFVENLYNCAFGKSMYKILAIRSDAIKKVFKDIKKEDVKSYMPMFEAAYIEGDTIISGYSKIIDALYNKYIEDKYYKELRDSYKFLIDFEKYKICSSKDIINCKESEGKYGKYRLKSVKTHIANITSNNEKYRIANYLINKLYKDISLGDIIVYKDPNNDINFGVVISRECDCVIRLNKIKEAPRRVANEYTVLLCEANEITTSLISSLKDKDKDYINRCILPIEYNNKLYSLKPTEKVRQFDTFILDLCSLNENGQASILYTEEFKDYKSFHSETYYREAFRQCIETEMNRYNDYEYIAKSDNITVLKNALISYNYGIKFENSKFCLNRICRLECKRTLLIIQNYIHNISLVGVDTPIVNETLVKVK